MDGRAEIRAFVAEWKPALRRFAWTSLYGGIPTLAWAYLGWRAALAVPILILGMALIWGGILVFRRIMRTEKKLDELLQQLEDREEMSVHDIDARSVEIENMAHGVDAALVEAEDIHAAMLAWEASGNDIDMRPMGAAFTKGLVTSRYIEWRGLAAHLNRELAGSKHPLSYEVSADQLPEDVPALRAAWETEVAEYRARFADFRSAPVE